MIPPRADWFFVFFWGPAVWLFWVIVGPLKLNEYLSFRTPVWDRLGFNFSNGGGGGRNQLFLIPLFSFPHPQLFPPLFFFFLASHTHPPHPRFFFFFGWGFLWFGGAKGGKEMFFFFFLEKKIFPSPGSSPPTVGR